MVGIPRSTACATCRRRKVKCGESEIQIPSADELTMSLQTKLNQLVDDAPTAGSSAVGTRRKPSGDIPPRPRSQPRTIPRSATRARHQQLTRHSLYVRSLHQHHLPKQVVSGCQALGRGARRGQSRPPRQEPPPRRRRYPLS